MSSIAEVAHTFFEACETGKGWAGCKIHCHPDATFSSQAEPIADINTLEGYCDWMTGLLTITPDGSYEIKAFSTDDNRNSVSAFGVFSATHTPVKAALYRQPAKAPRPTTSTSWSLKAIRLNT